MRFIVKLSLILMFSLSLIIFTSCIEVTSMTDMEIVLIDEGFSIIEYPKAQVNDLNDAITLQMNCDCQVLRVIEGRKNQITEVYIIEFDSRSDATRFFKILDEGNFNITDFEYWLRRGRIVMIAIDQNMLSLFEGK
ncbi:MAG: hypothetical protein Q7I99_00790 [Acholeplasmataceae bacterium]|nr:hypothetical protein [Acholeplasmataceae bacterium]